MSSVYKILPIFISLLLNFVHSSNLIDKIQIIYNKSLNNSGAIFNLSLNNFQNFRIKSSRLHSTQFKNSSSINNYFRISDKQTSLEMNHNLDRSSLCSSIKFCSTNSSKCLINFSMIFYLSSETHFNQIKLVKFEFSINDFEQDSLIFDRDEYDFKINNLSNIGQVKASSIKNKDMNNLIKYILEFKSSSSSQSSSRLSLSNLLKIDENTGVLSLSEKSETLLASHSQTKFEFYVGAMMQCSMNQPALFNKTLVRLSIDSNIKSDNSPKINTNITNLVQTMPLRTTGNDQECLKLVKNDLIFDKSVEKSNLIALAQIQIEQLSKFSLQNDDLMFDLEPSLRPDEMKFLKFEIQFLVDNIYIVYLVKQENLVLNNPDFYLNVFMNNVFKLTLKISDKKHLLKEDHIYMCIEEDSGKHEDNSRNDLFYELSMFKFRPNLYTVKSRSQSNYLTVEKLDEKSQNIKYFIDYNSNVLLNEEQNDQITIKQIENSFDRDLIELKIDDLVSKNAQKSFDSTEFDKIETLQQELLLVAYDSQLANKMNINIHSVYDYLKQIAYENKKFLHFTSKILINKKQYNEIDDGTIRLNSLNNYTFIVKSKSLIKQSILGHLPSVHDLDLSNESKWLSYDKNLIQNYYYDLVEHENNNNECFKLDKYDGTLYLKSAYLFKNCSRDLRVNLEHNQPGYKIENFARIQILDLPVDANTNSVKMVYNLDKNRLLAVFNHTEKKMNTQIDSDLYFRIDMPQRNKNDQKLIKLIDFVSLFGLNLNQLESTSSMEYKTQFELDSNKELNAQFFAINTKKGALFLNSSKLDHELLQNCLKINLNAKNYVYFNSIKRKMISMDRFSLNLCLFINKNSEKFLVEPILDLSVNYQHLIKKGNENNLFYLLRNDLLTSLWYIVIGLFALGSISLLSVLAYLSCNKKMSGHHKSFNITLPENSNNEFRSISSSSCGTSSYGSSQLQIRNESPLSHGYYTSPIYFTRQQNEMIIVPNKLDALLKKNPTELMKQLEDQFFKEESISEDQGVYCVQSSVSPVSTSIEKQINENADNDSNISSVTMKSQATENHREANLLKLSLFDFTPNYSSIQRNHHPIPNYNSGINQNMLIYSPMRANFNQNSTRKNLTKEIQLSAECII
jgi:hypothetical protein